MSLYHSPRIVTNGLVFCLDAANKRSYPGSGTAGLDISGNNNNSVLLNGVSFSPNNGGYFLFDGVNDYISINNSSTLQFGETFSINCWIFANNLSNRYGIFSTRFNSPSGSWQLEVGIANSGQGRIAVTGPGTWIWESQNDVIESNRWYNICYVKQNNVTQGGTMYLNSQQINPMVTTAFNILNNSDIKVIGSGTLAGQLFPGRISNTFIYNRPLSALEVNQNFNALRGRYGL